MKWRRQEPLGRFIVDFLCYEARLIIEVDGDQHANSTYDITRDRWLEDQGFSVVRFFNSEVNSEIDAVMDTIARAINSALT
jgi:very-short-patch-repair endonuclease